MASFSNRLRQIILLIALLALGFLLIKELYVFLPGFLGALTLYILSRGWFRKITIIGRWNKSLAASLFLIAFLVLFGLPVYWIFSLIAPRINLRN
jgi:predicted PurR-regulated permease PerM